MIRTVNRASAISLKRELLPVLWVQLKAVYSASWCRLLLNKRKKQKLNIFIVKHCNWLPCAHSACRQAGKIEILFQLSWLFHRWCTPLMTKYYFWSLPLLTALFQKLCVGSPHIRMNVTFTVKSLSDMEYFFICNCKFFSSIFDQVKLE